MSNERTAGASASLHKTISEIMEYMDDDRPRPPADLRSFMYERIADVAEWWFQEGFYWGHKQSQLLLTSTGEIPATIELDYGEAGLAPECWREISLRSRIRRM